MGCNQSKFLGRGVAEVVAISQAECLPQRVCCVLIKLLKFSAEPGELPDTFQDALMECGTFPPVMGPHSP